MDTIVENAKMSLETIKGEIITQTLDTLNATAKKTSKKNRGTQSAMADAYDLNKSVLSAAYEGKGTIIDNKP